MAMKQIPWHSFSLEEVKNRLSTDFDNGLEEKEIAKRHKRWGKNIFEKKKKFYYPKLLWKQTKSPLVFILIIAGVITFFLKEYGNTIVIFIAVFINAAMGVFQEGKASMAFDKLRASQKKSAVVIRNGRKKVIESSDLAPGDIIEIQMGDQVPADSRLIASKGMEANESLLTGEWMPIEKDFKKTVAEKAHIAERGNMLWMGALITEGWGRAVVVETGFHTEIGKIAKFVEEEDIVVTPLQKSIKKLAKFLGAMTVAALFMLLALGLWRGQNFFDILLTSVALAVSAIPEGLPVAMTVVLAIGMQKIFTKGGLVKNLESVETLGSASVILTDKTGTLTKAEMNVSKIITLLSEENKGKETEHKDRLAILHIALFASEAFIENPEDDLAEWVIRGNPMERAICLASIESGLQPVEEKIKNKRIDFVPFDTERRYTASLYKKDAQKSAVYAMGAPEVIAGLCAKIYKGGNEFKINEKILRTLEKAYEEETSKGARALAVAYKNGNWASFSHNKKEGEEEILSNMTLGGFIVFHDPLREDASAYIRDSKEASIRTVLVTGDHMETAKKIGQEVGIMKKDGIVLSGDDLEKLDEKQLDEIIDKVDIFARVLPGQKLKIVNAWQRRGDVVAMTGDGVNDAPALKHADIGLALGSGTEVAKEASDMILLNDGFNAIVEAIKEGRRILDNLRKIIAYLLSTSFSEILLVASSLIIGAPLPLLPAQILWVNIIEEGFMNFAFAFEPMEEDILRRDPKKEQRRGILTLRMKKMIASIVAVTSALLISLFVILHQSGYSTEKLRTIMFAAVAIDAIFFSFSLKNLRKPIWRINIFSNLYLLFSLSLSVLLFVLALALPVLRNLLSLVPLNFMEIILIAGIGVLNLLTIEISKYFIFEKK